jgi:hypothetical protein
MEVPPDRILSDSVAFANGNLYHVRVFWVFLIFALEFAAASLPFLVVLCFLAITIQHLLTPRHR